MEAKLVTGDIPVPDIPTPVTYASPASVVINDDRPLILRTSAYQPYVTVLEIGKSINSGEKSKTEIKYSKHFENVLVDF